jgi:hypothetical protein
VDSAAAGVPAPRQAPRVTVNPSLVVRTSTAPPHA